MLSLPPSKSSPRIPSGRDSILNKSYKGGVAMNSKVKSKGGKTNHKPYVSSALYKAYKDKDRDKDGIACER
ncbi:excalibur calcium-binding domain-containing protein [Domibacillus sp. PGB-M46]|nr:excalibur calcium-binding domain-containing protein [Domibacillus sp. PGB-M46]MCI2254194.1 excalibur calcium-binding domain-containing protein [Domibacillus sp. PGB-M46]